MYNFHLEGEDDNASLQVQHDASIFAKNMLRKWWFHFFLQTLGIMFAKDMLRIFLHRKHGFKGL
jgi:hypothetical protein